MTISGDEPKGGAGSMKVLLVSAATIVAAETLTAAQAADTALKKAPSVQYVRVCDIYGAGFFQLPGTVFAARSAGNRRSTPTLRPVRTPSSFNKTARRTETPTP
jgi:hypothetical protein